MNKSKTNLLIITLFSIITFNFIACKESKKEEAPVESTSMYKLTKLWESDTVFTTVEAALYDATTDIIYVSNIEGDPWGHDGKGSIGRLKPDGTTFDAKWITGLNAPKGLGIVGNKLYVTDNFALVEIDIPTGKIIKRYEVKDCGGLNDVTTSPEGIVYFTDSQQGAIHKLENGNVSMIIDSLKGSNGIFYEKDRLLFATWGDESLNEYRFADQKTNILADTLTQPDGIEAVGDGGYLVSAWKGLINYVAPDGKTTLILDTAKDTISSADIDYIQDKKILLVPTFFRNTIAAYRLEK